MPRSYSCYFCPDYRTTSVVAFAILLSLSLVAADASAQTISIDPETHEILPVAPSGDPSSAAAVPNGAFVAGPSVAAPVTSVIEGGGVLVELNGAFRSRVVGNVDHQGNFNNECSTGGFKE